jgi:hypothetical protein
MMFNDRQVFWLSARNGFPSPSQTLARPVACRGSLADYSGGPATDSHRFPYCPPRHAAARVARHDCSVSPTPGNKPANWLRGRAACQAKRESIDTARARLRLAAKRIASRCCGATIVPHRAPVACKRCLPGPGMVRRPGGAFVACSATSAGKCSAGRISRATGPLH